MYIKKSIKNYIDDLAAKKPTPGGGSASALVAALGAALGSMVANFTIGNARYLKVQPKVRILLKQNELIRKKLLLLVDKDTLVYLKLNSALKLPKENKKRSALIQKYLKNAANAPFSICDLCYRAMNLCLEIANLGNYNLLSDVGCAAQLLESAYQCALLNVKVNLKYIKDKKFQSQKTRALKRISRLIPKLKQFIIRKAQMGI